MRRLLTCALVLLTFATASAQSDLDALMARVLERRDESWKKLQQYTLHEHKTLQLTGFGGARVFGSEREYLWFPRAGFFIRSPLTADGVTIGEEQRRREEESWLRCARDREKARSEGKRPEPCAEGGVSISISFDDSEPAGGASAPLPAGIEDIVAQSFEPQFIESANLLRFRFDAGRYALAGRERMLDREVLKVEYYPKALFKDDPNLNKVSLVTLWIDPASSQVLRYVFDNIDLDYLPGRWLARIDGMHATMQMSEPFAGVWLPAAVSVRFGMALAAGPLEARIEKRYTDYRLPAVDSRMLPEKP
jgi:hypothetical protein